MKRDNIKTAILIILILIGFILSNIIVEKNNINDATNDTNESNNTITIIGGPVRTLTVIGSENVTGTINITEK